jgi:hypothetical protein
MQIFNGPQSEPDYRAWLFSHPSGFVVNHRATTPVLHRATCPSITRETPPGGKNYTTSAKYCSDTRDELIEVENTTPEHCGMCNP